MILVTGATGHLGNVLVRELVLSGEKVRALVRPGEPLKSLQGMLIEVFVGDILDREAVEKALAGVQTVFHLAGVISIRPGMEKAMERVNVEGTRIVAEAALSSGVKRFVHVSSVHALRREPHGTVMDESTPLALDSPAGSYDRTKAEGTRAVLDAVERGLNAVIACPSGIIGSHDYMGSEVGKALAAFTGPYLDLLVDGAFDFVDVRDVARGLILARDRGARGEIYILSGTRVSIEQLHQMAQQASGTRTPKMKIPMRAALFCVSAIQGFLTWLRIKSPYTVYSLQTLAENSAFSSLKARRDFGYRPRPLEEAVADYITWFRSRQKKKPVRRVRALRKAGPKKVHAGSV